jgi:hypothetical protein
MLAVSSHFLSGVRKPATAFLRFAQSKAVEASLAAVEAEVTFVISVGNITGQSM